MTSKRDLIYEKELQTHIINVTQNLDRKSSLSSFSLDEYYAIERMMQILIESVIGLARYTLKVCFGLTLSKSGELFEELFKRKILTEYQYQEIKKMVGYRNVLVHDYLNVNPLITSAIVHSRQYALVEKTQDILLQALSKNENSPV